MNFRPNFVQCYFLKPLSIATPSTNFTSRTEVFGSLVYSNLFHHIINRYISFQPPQRQGDWKTSYSPVSVSHGVLCKSRFTWLSEQARQRSKTGFPRFFSFGREKRIFVGSPNRPLESVRLTFSNRDYLTKIGRSNIRFNRNLNKYEVTPIIDIITSERRSLFLGIFYHTIRKYIILKNITQP